jgi:ribosomal protein S18 acetylase RimI-like enzyme
MAEWTAAYSEWTYEVEDVIDADESRVVATILQRGRLKGSDAWVDLRVAFLFIVEDGLVRRIEVYASPEQALEAPDGRSRWMVRLRTAQGNDLQLLQTLAFEAAFWRPEVVRPPFAEALAVPQLARYVEYFGRPGDFGLVAEEDSEPLGAAWWRYFRADAPGYGFVDEATPEVSVAVLPGHRGRGIGTALLEALIVEARERPIDRLSLSVEDDNPATALYARLGFQSLSAEGNALTMVIKLQQ